MKRLAFFLITVGVFAATITGLYLPPEGRSAKGVKISIGDISFKTEKGGFFFVNGIKEGVYSLKVEGKTYGELRVSGDFVRLWIDGVDEVFYVTRNVPEISRAELEGKNYFLEEALFLSPDLSYYRGNLFFQGLSQVEIVACSAYSPYQIFPYSQVKSAQVSVAYPRASIRIVEKPMELPGLRITSFLLKTSHEDRADSYSISPYVDAGFGYGSKNLGGYISALSEDRSFSSPEEQTIRKKALYFSLSAYGLRGFYHYGREAYENLRERPYYSLSSAWQGESKESGFGVGLSRRGFSLTAASFNWKRELEPVASSQYFLFDDVTLFKGYGNYRETLEKKILSLNSSVVFHSTSFLGLNNVFAVGAEVLSREVQGNRGWPLELVSFAGEAGFAYLRTPDSFHYRLYTAGLWLSDTIVTGNVNLSFSAGYNAQWFKVFPSSSPDAEIMGLSLEGASVSSFTSKLVHIVGLKAGLSYDPFRNGFLVLRLYGSYRGLPLPESLLYRASSSLSYGKFLWNDDGDLVPEEGEFSTLYTYRAQASLEDVPLYPPGLEPSRFYRFGAGISSDLPLGLSADIDLFFIKNTLPYVEVPFVWKDDKWGLVSWGDWEEGGDFPMEFGGQKWFALEEGKFFNGYYQTLNLISVERSWKEFRLRLKKSGPLSFLIQVNLRSNSFSINENLYPLDPGNLNFLLSQPWGPSTNGFYHSPVLNSRWAVLFSLWWRSRGWSLGGTFRAREGYIVPVYYLDTEPLRPGLYDYPQGLAAPLNQFRLPTWWRLDLHLQKEFSVGGFRVQAFLRALNLLNTRVPMEEWENVLYSDFLSPRWYYPPRQVLLGLKILR